MLTARTNDRDMLHGFSLGVDDFVRKPFNKNEFEARVRALLRRSAAQIPNPAAHIHQYEDDVLTVDLASQTVRLNDVIVELSPREYNLLAYLVQSQGMIISKHELMREVWGDPVATGLSNPSLYVYYLRKKLQDGQHGHTYIHTLWGRGYWFEPRKE